MDIYSRVEKARELIKTALKIEEMPPDKLKRFKQFILMFEIKNESWIKGEVIKMIDERLELRIEKARELVIEYRDAMHYYRKKMIEGEEKLQIYKNAVDEFIKRHPEYKEELNGIIKQEEEESEEMDE